MIGTCVSVFLVGNIELLETAQAAVSVAVRVSQSWVSWVRHRIVSPYSILVYGYQTSLFGFILSQSVKWPGSAAS